VQRSLGVGPLPLLYAISPERSSSSGCGREAASQEVPDAIRAAWLERWFGRAQFRGSGGFCPSVLPQKSERGCKQPLSDPIDSSLKTSYFGAGVAAAGAAAASTRYCAPGAGNEFFMKKL
jgi:hypothetical protein